MGGIHEVDDPHVGPRGVLTAQATSLLLQHSKKRA
jgi:hypothetical protein